MITGTGWQKGNSIVVGKDGVNSGNNAWVTGLTGNYVNNAEAYLYTPNYNFSLGGTYNFSFYTKYNCEANYDGFRIEYSTDTGKIWQPLGTTVAANWYNFANTTDQTAFTFGQAFFSGNFGTSYVKKNYDISSLAGNGNVCFRFAFKSDGGVTGVGVAIDDFEITGPINGILPTTIVNFNASKQSKNTLLQWATTNEINVNHFAIERSWDGNRFSEVGNVVAQNRSNNSYTFKDLLSSISKWPSTTTFYRLKVVDKNGAFKYSNVLQLQWNDIQQVLVSISPNPFSNYIQIDTKAKIQQIQLFNLSGQVVFSTQTVKNGRIDLSNGIAKGNYLIKIYTDKGTAIEKVIKQ